MAAPIHLLRAGLPHLRAQGSGGFVRASTMGAQISSPDGSTYHASKWGAALRLPDENQATASARRAFSPRRLTVTARSIFVHRGRPGRNRDAQQHVPALDLRFRAVSEEKERDDPGDFGGISFGGMAFMLAVVALGRPREMLKELFRLARRLGRQTLGLVTAPFRLVTLIVWSRPADRHPTFEDHLHGVDEDRDPS